jgi:hypothetical protein
MGTRLGLSRTRIERTHARLLARVARVCASGAVMRSTHGAIAPTHTRLHATRAAVRRSGGAMQTTRARLAPMGARLGEIRAAMRETHAGNSATRTRLRSTRARFARMGARVCVARELLCGARAFLEPTRGRIRRARPGVRGVTADVTSMHGRVPRTAPRKRTTRARLGHRHRCLQCMMHWANSSRKGVADQAAHPGRKHRYFRARCYRLKARRGP